MSLCHRKQRNHCYGKMFVRNHVHNYNYCYQCLYLNNVNTVISISAGIYSHKYNDVITGKLINESLVRSPQSR